MYCSIYICHAYTWYYVSEFILSGYRQSSLQDLVVILHVASVSCWFLIFFIIITGVSHTKQWHVNHYGNWQCYLIICCNKRPNFHITTYNQPFLSKPNWWWCMGVTDPKPSLLLLLSLLCYLLLPSLGLDIWLLNSTHSLVPFSSYSFV